MPLATKRIKGALSTIEANGAAVVAGAFSGVSSAYDNSVDEYPLADFLLSSNFSVAPVGTIDLYVQEIDVDGVLDTGVPSSTYKERFVGSFKPAQVTGDQPVLMIKGAPLPSRSAYVCHDNTDQDMSAAWVLKVQPYGYGS